MTMKPFIGVISKARKAEMLQRRAGNACAADSLSQMINALKDASKDLDLNAREIKELKAEIEKLKNPPPDQRVTAIIDELYLLLDKRSRSGSESYTNGIKEALGLVEYIVKEGKTEESNVHTPDRFEQWQRWKGVGNPPPKWKAVHPDTKEEWTIYRSYEDYCWD